MKNLIVVILISFLLTGCTVKGYIPATFITMNDNVRIYSKNKIVSVTAPQNRGIPFIGNFNHNNEWVNLIRFINGEMVEKIYIRHTYDPTNFDFYKYLDKKNLDSFEKDIKDNKKIIYRNEYNGRKYKKAFIDYVDGIKCRTFPWDNLSGMYNNTSKQSILTQVYETYCSFYGLGVAGHEQLLHIYYEYSYNFESDIFKNSNKTKEQILKDIQNQFKQDIKEIFNSIKLHYMDRERMKKEGLLYDKKYEIRDDL
ncbi:hypothetical protein ACN2EN_04025 [Aliarcobacter lanthieri]|uniref:hypothetical protein n=1 Tax=Aliarcobacter lanthieri TaxID=1355374 RepID=UPI003AFA5978